MSAKLIKPDDTEEDIVPENGTNFTLKEIYQHIGCSTFELLQSGSKFGNIIILVDEDGNQKKLPQNKKASEYWSEWNKPHPTTYLLGNAILCNEEMVK